MALLILSSVSVTVKFKSSWFDLTKLILWDIPQNMLLIQIMSSPHERDQCALRVCAHTQKAGDCSGSHLSAFYNNWKIKLAVNKLLIQIMSFPHEKDQYVCEREHKRGGYWESHLPASCNNWKIQLVVLFEIAAFPSRWFFLAAFPAVIWSLDCRRTFPGLSSNS